MKIIVLLLVALPLWISGCASTTPAPVAFSPTSAPWNDNDAVAALFQQTGLHGTFVLYDPAEQTLTGYNHARAVTRYVPASTFKIPNSLIGLETGAVPSVDEPLPYGGAPQPFTAWEKDMGLREGIKVSNVPVYQELARRIGLSAMQKYVSAFEYGNADIGTTVDLFWLRGPLKISAVEQTAFLVRLAKNQLPAAVEHQNTIKQIAMLEQAPGWTLYGKTGTATSSQPNIGWWVGWVEKDGKIYVFALNIDIPAEKDTIKALENAWGQRLTVGLGRACLKVLGIL